MSTELQSKLLAHLKVTTGNPVFDVVLDSGDHAFTGNAYHIHAFLKSLSQASLSFVYYQAKEFRSKGDFNKAMLKVSELVRDHVTALRSIQLIFDRISGDEPRSVILKQFGQVESLEVHLKNAPHTLQVVEKTISPWRELHSEVLYEFLGLERQVELEQDRLELFKRLSPAQVSSAEIDEQQEIFINISERQEELRREIAIMVVGLAQNIIDDMAVHLVEPDRSKHFAALLGPLATIVLSDIATKRADNV
jgi:hypothetical protein